MADLIRARGDRATAGAVMDVGWLKFRALVPLMDEAAARAVHYGSGLREIRLATVRLARLLDRASAGNDDAAAILEAATSASQILSENEALPQDARDHLVQKLRPVVDRAEPPNALLNMIGEVDRELADLATAAFTSAMATPSAPAVSPDVAPVTPPDPAPAE